MSPNLSLVCISAHVLWSCAASAARRRRMGRGDAGGESSAAAAPAAYRRTPGELPRRRTDACRPPTPPSILKQLEKSINFCTQIVIIIRFFSAIIEHSLLSQHIIKLVSIIHKRIHIDKTRQDKSCLLLKCNCTKKKITKIPVVIKLLFINIKTLQRSSSQAKSFLKLKIKNFNLSNSVFRIDKKPYLH